MAATSPTFLFLGYCSHTDLLREYLDRTGRGRVTSDPHAADAVCVFERDAAQHAALALPHLEAGLPVFVEKPFALTVDDARRMLRAGSVTSFSTLRWAEPLASLRGATALRVTGPARPDDPSGLAFYAVHAIEIAQQVCGGRPGAVRVTRRGDGAVVDYALDGRDVHLDLAPGRDRWLVSATMPDGEEREVAVTAGPGYFEPACERIVDFALTGRSPVPASEMAAVVEVVSAAAGR